MCLLSLAYFLSRVRVRVTMEIRVKVRVRDVMVCRLVSHLATFKIIPGQEDTIFLSQFHKSWNKGVLRGPIHKSTTFQYTSRRVNGRSRNLLFQQQHLFLL